MKRDGWIRPITGIQRHKLLTQIVSICVTLVLLPSLFAMLVVSRQSYQRLISSYESAYLETSEKFAGLFTQKINQICKNAYLIASDSRDAQKSAGNLDTEKVAQNSFGLYNAVQAIAEYAQSNNDLLGIYYEDIDRFLTRKSSFSSRTFLSDYLGLEDTPAQEERLASFVSGGDARLAYYVPNAPDARWTLLVGVRITLGRSRNSALAVYSLDQSAVDANLLVANNPEQVQFAVLDRDLRLLLWMGTAYYQAEELQGLLSEIGRQDSFAATRTFHGEKLIVGVNKDAATGFFFLLAVPLNEVAGGAQTLYALLTKVMLILIFILSVAVTLLAYINYRPLRRLLGKLKLASRDADEFDVISDEINRMTDEISEQNMLIVDCLLGNMLYGVPIADEVPGRIGFPTDVGRYFVFTLFGGTLDTNHRTVITTRLLSEYATKVYITDLPTPRTTVLVCASDRDEEAAIEAFLQDYFARLFPSGFALRRGAVVSSANDIRLSYADCLRGESAAAGLPEALSCDDKTDELMRYIVQYIDTHFTDPGLCQSSVADSMHISTYTLSRLFKSKSGIGYTEYVTRKRVQLAKELLSGSAATVSSVSTSVGIPSVNYFYKVFKAVTGMSPMQYRSRATGLLKKKANGEQSDSSTPENR